MLGYHCALQSEALIHLRGAKIAQFLQGQLTCDTRLLTAERPLRGALCNPKGRVLADLIVLQFSDEHIGLRLHASIARGCAATLETYARFSRITCEVDNHKLGLLGLWTADGNEIDAATLDVDLAYPAHSDQMTRSGERLSYFSAPGMLEVLAPGDTIAELARSLQSCMRPEEQWRARALMAGIYRIDTPDIGKFVPQALNYDLADYVSFNKGCYTGQEVVARLHYKGQSKRRLAVFTTPLTPQSLPPSGSAVITDSGERVGEVLRTERDADNREVLAVALQVDAWSHPALRLEIAPERTLTNVPLPYS